MSDLNERDLSSNPDLMSNQECVLLIERLRAALRSDSPDRGSVKSPTGVCSECGRILYRPASTGGERDAVPVDLQGSQPIGAGPHKGEYRRIPDSTEPNDG